MVKEQIHTQKKSRHASLKPGSMPSGNLGHRFRTEPTELCDKEGQKLPYVRHGFIFLSSDFKAFFDVRDTGAYGLQLYPIILVLHNLFPARRRVPCSTSMRLKRCEGIHPLPLWCVPEGG
jgi:hypothetical protein